MPVRDRLGPGRLDQLGGRRRGDGQPGDAGGLVVVHRLGMGLPHPEGDPGLIDGALAGVGRLAPTAQGEIRRVQQRQAIGQQVLRRAGRGVPGIGLGHLTGRLQVFGQPHLDEVDQDPVARLHHQLSRASAGVPALPAAISYEALRASTNTCSPATPGILPVWAQ